jgi:beta-glucanase (GH16 family)
MTNLTLLLSYLALNIQSFIIQNNSYQDSTARSNLKFRRSSQSTQESGTCKPFTANFKNGLNPLFTYDGPVTTKNGNLQIKFSKGNTPNPITDIIQGYGGTASSTQSYLYGKFTARLKTARIGGVVSAFILMSPQKDEIDWEWVGKDERSSQTNYFSKGVEDYTKGQTTPNSFNTHAEFHDYGIIWTPDSITWTIDEKPVRKVTKESTLGKDGVYHYPNTKAPIKLNVWDGGAGEKGTKDWAGGVIDFNDSEYTKNGGFISMDIEWVKYECI